MQALDEFDLKHEGKQLSATPPIEYEERLIGQRSGNPRIVRVPKGVDPSFEHPKRAVPVETVDKLIMQNLVNDNPKFASLAVNQVLSHPPALKLLNQSMAEMVNKVASEKMARGEMKFVGVIPPNVIDTLTALNKAPDTAIIAVRDEDILHALRDSKQAKAINLPITFWQSLPEKLREPTAILLEEQQKQPTLLFIYQTEQGKVAIKMDYEVQIKNKETKDKAKVKLNMVRTGSLINGDLDWLNLKNSYELLWGQLD